MYDTHCHPYLQKNKKVREVFKNFKESGSFLNSIWVDIETSVKSIELSEQNAFVYASIWIHPCYVLKYKDSLDESIEKLESLYLKNKKNIIAVWECWLDYHWLENISDESSIGIEEIRALQKEFFKAQINLAKKLWLPLIIHNRNSKDDVFEILKENQFKNFIFHCYSEDLDYAIKLIDFAPSCKISFSWIITFKNAFHIQETSKSIPLENIIAETDSPYLTPVPFRWKQENEPEFTKYVIEKIVELRSEGCEQIKKQIFENSLSIFWLQE